MSRITMITGHYWGSKRKAGFHHLANALQELGHEVLFFTAPVSKLHKLKNDHIFQYPIEQEANVVVKKDKLLSYVHYTPFHIANTKYKISNFLTSPLSSIYSKFSIQEEAQEFIRNSDYIIFESTPGLFLFDRIKKINRSAKYIYRVSDDLRFLRVHPSLIKYEDKIVSKFDLVSVVSTFFFKTFTQSNVKLRFNGINKAVFDQEYENPYSSNAKNLLFIGNASFDFNFLEVASALYPDMIFHIIGPIKDLPAKKNIQAYGEIPFLDTIKFIKHADVGLHTITYKDGAESMTDALKALQYTYAKVPIVAPEFLKNSRPHTFYYTSGPNSKQSIKVAIDNALSFPKEKIENGNILDWKELAEIILTD